MTDVAANKALIAAFMDALNHQDWEALRRLCILLRECLTPPPRGATLGATRRHPGAG
jgi:hypothetical protein